MTTFVEGVGLVTQVLVAVGVVANVFQNILQSQSLNSIHHKVETVEHATNSMKDDLVTAVRAEAFQAGKLDEAASTKASSAPSSG